LQPHARPSLVRLQQAVATRRQRSTHGDRRQDARTEKMRGIMLGWFCHSNKLLRGCNLLEASALTKLRITQST
ncbi:MAG TPA: hypothetical protein VNA86_01250, partial [bacterium]|nr:hypothetical protein [bacterium]